MSKKEIECEYCHTLISEDDVKCPECGANCTNVIKKYREEKKEEQKRQEEEQKREAQEKINSAKEMMNDFQKTSKVISAIISIVFIVIFAFAFFQISKNFNRDDTFPNGIKDEPFSDVEDNDKKEIVKVGYKETGEVNNFVVTLDNYELFEYKSDNFESYNTPKGYQKIAFHFVLENKSDSSKSLYHIIDLTADDYPVERTKTEVTPNFSKVVKGKEKYENIESQTLKSGQNLKGYVGFLVPKDKKVLKFIMPL
jgi:uncharacterized membrane protein YvbJ